MSDYERERLTYFRPIKLSPYSKPYQQHTGYERDLANVAYTLALSIPINQRPSKIAELTAKRDASGLITEEFYLLRALRSLSVIR